MPRRVQLWNRARRPGFTLLEILMVAALMVLMLSIAVTSSLDWGRQTAMRSSLHSIEAGLAMARQFAVTSGRRVYFTYANVTNPTGTFGMYAISNRLVALENTNFLPRGVIYSAGPTQPIAFGANGSCRLDVGSWISDQRDIIIEEDARGANGMIRTVRVWRTTGLAEILE